MSRTWLLLDMDFLAYLAFFTTGGLTGEVGGTGVVYGVLRDVVNLRQEHSADEMVFAFDVGKGKRETKYPWYKERRRNKQFRMTEEEFDRFKDFKSQVHKLRTEYLLDLGFQNVFGKDGYEADDIIGAMAKAIPKSDTVIIVSADKDLYQLLRKKTMVWNPNTKEMYTRKKFRDEYGIYPDQWVLVKAIAGCQTDDIPGVPRVGDKTAAKYLLGSLPNRAVNDSIVEFVKSNQYHVNLSLVTLPYDGLGPLIWTTGQDNLTSKSWRSLMDRLGFKSMRDKVPGGR